MMKKTIEELRAERATLETEAREIIRSADGADIEGPDAERFDSLTAKLETVKGEIQAIERRIESVRSLADEPGNVVRGTDQGVRHREQSPRESVRDNALRLVDRSQKAGDLPDHAASTVETLVRADSFAARWAVTTGSDAYREAFSKLIADPLHGHQLWGPAEQQAYRDVSALASEWSLLESGSGQYLLPFQLDPSVMLSNNGSVNPIRQISRVVTCTTNAWHGVSSAGVTSNWTGEATEVSDSSPVLTQPAIPVFKGASWVAFSYEQVEDSANLVGQLGVLLADAKDQLEAVAFVTGNGTTQPKGIITALVAAGGSIIVTGSGTEALAAADAYALQNSLAPRWQPKAQWAMGLPTINTFAQFETASGAIKFAGLQTNPRTLLGRNVNDVSSLDSVINPAATEANYVAIYGDFANYVVADRIGTSVELVSHVFGSNNRPTGERGLYMHWRTGADTTIPNAFRVLNVPTTSP